MCFSSTTTESSQFPQLFSRTISQSSCPHWPKDVLGQYQNLHWYVKNKLVFGKNCVIDLRSQETLPPKPPKAANGVNATYNGSDGGAGKDGVDGTNGITGVDLILNIVDWDLTGSLWIRTDGTSGTDGGDGGDGGNGADGKCDFLGGVNGGNGGKGGNGGRGGDGGDTARVQIRYGSLIGGPVLPIVLCNRDNCGGRYDHPPASDDGIIRVLGSPGCGGKSGKGGVGGAGGGGDNCGFLRSDQHPGWPGDPGLDGHGVRPNPCFLGATGECRSTQSDVFPDAKKSHPPEVLV